MDLPSSARTSLTARHPGVVTNTSTSVILGSRPVHRIGFGAMQLPGPGVFGPPKDRNTALQILRRAVEAGVNHIDTAQFYGPDVANELIRQALHPYPEDLVLVSKVGAARNAEGHWLAAQTPDELRAGVEANLASLGVDQVPVVNLRRHPDSVVPFPEQLGAMIALRDEGLIGHIGLSNATLDEYLDGQGPGPNVACVQNSYSVARPLGAGSLRRLPRRRSALRALLSPRLGLQSREPRARPTR